MKIPIALSILLLSTALAAGKSATEWIETGDHFDSWLQTSEALSAYLKAEKISPDDPDLLIRIATQYGESMVDAETEEQEKAAGEKALEYARRALQLAPAKSDAHLAVAVCNARLMDFLPAKTRGECSRRMKEQTEKALELDPRNDLAWHMLGRWHQAMADMGALTKGLVKLIYGGLPPSSIDQSISCFQKAVRPNPDRVAHQIELGRSLAMAGENPRGRSSRSGAAFPCRTGNAMTPIPRLAAGRP